MEPLLEVRSVPADAVLTWRRSVYERGLWAVPLAADGAAGGAGGGGAASGVGRERRVEEWVGRELRALFQSDVRVSPRMSRQCVHVKLLATTDGRFRSSTARVR